MKDRLRSVYDLGLLVVILCAVAFATVTVYSQNQTTPQTPAPAARSTALSRVNRPTKFYQNTFG
jgi:hypothetical protein